MNLSVPHAFWEWEIVIPLLPIFQKFPGNLLGDDVLSAPKEQQKRIKHVYQPGQRRGNLHNYAKRGHHWRSRFFNPGWLNPCPARQPWRSHDMARRDMLEPVKLFHLFCQCGWCVPREGNEKSVNEVHTWSSCGSHCNQLFRVQILPLYFSAGCWFWPNTAEN